MTSSPRQPKLSAALPLLLETEIERLRFACSDRYLLRLGPEFLLPRRDGVVARRQILDLEVPSLICD